MQALFIGGTGLISSAVVRQLAAMPQWEVWVLNRGLRKLSLPQGVHQLTVDIHNETAVAAVLESLHFDVVADFIAFREEDVARDYRLFKGRTSQFMYISSASVYHKPVADYVITEGTSLSNPYWQYSRDKIACEEFLLAKYREEAFPLTIVRPSHTYGEGKLPAAVHGTKGSWQVLKRMIEGKAIIVPGDGSSLWSVTFNEDFAAGFIGLMGNAHAIGEAFHIASEDALTWDQIQRKIAQALGVDYKPYHIASDLLAALGPEYDFSGSLLGDKAMSVVFDNSKLKRVVPGFQLQTRFDQVVQRCVDYSLTHKDECQQEDPAFDRWCDLVIERLETVKRDWR